MLKEKVRRRVQEGDEGGERDSQTDRWTRFKPQRHTRLLMLKMKRSNLPVVTQMRKEEALLRLLLPNLLTSIIFLP